MPFLESLPDNAGPPNIFKRYPQLYGLWSEMSQVLMNGPSPLSEGEREMILAYAAGVSGCEFVFIGHSEVAYAWGIEAGLLDSLLDNLETAPIDHKLRPLLGYVGKLATQPTRINQADVDAVLAAGWDEQALHDAIAITGRAKFMQCLVQGFGFEPLDRAVAQSHAQKRVERGYVNLYRTFRKDDNDASSTSQG